MEVEVCVRCGAAVLDRADLENLTSSAVMSAPEARATPSPVSAARPAPTPARPERKKPWDFTPRPAPPRKPPRRVEKTLIPTLLEEGGDETTEEGPTAVAHRIHDSEPPVRPREATPESELPTGPPTPAPIPKASAPRAPKGKGGHTPPLQLEPSLKRAPGAPPPPPTLGRTVRPEDGNAPAIRPAVPMSMSPEPGLGTIPPTESDGPGLDLGAPEPSTEEVPLEPTDHDMSRWAARTVEPAPEWEPGPRRLRTGLFVASAVAAGGALLALLAIGAWLLWLGPRWREHAATADGPDLTQIVGTPAGDLVVEHPEIPEPDELLVPDEIAVPDEAPSPDEPLPVEPSVPDEVAVAAPVPSPAPAASPEPRPAPAAPAPRPSSRSALIEQGWDNVESNPAKAMAAFGAVLEASPDDHEAAYGYGYALLESGDTAGAAPYLCRARPSPDVTIQREVAGLLARHGIDCP